MYIVVIGPLGVEFWILPSLALCLWSLGGDGLRGCMEARGSVPDASNNITFQSTKNKLRGAPNQLNLHRSGC
jgi:hypothetical protein